MIDNELVYEKESFKVSDSDEKTISILLPIKKTSKSYDSSSFTIIIMSFQVFVGGITVGILDKPNHLYVKICLQYRFWLLQLTSIELLHQLSLVIWYIRTLPHDWRKLLLWYYMLRQCIQIVTYKFIRINFGVDDGYQ